MVLIYPALLEAYFCLILPIFKPEYLLNTLLSLHIPLLESTPNVKNNMKKIIGSLFLFITIWTNAQENTSYNPSKEPTQKAPILLENIQDLKNFKNPVQGDIAYVQGYYTINDRGGGYFYYLNPTNAVGLTPDSGMNIAPNEGIGIWKRINYGEISVAFFGAKGGDTLDDTLAVQEAIDFVANYFKTSAPKGGIVNFPKGTYYVQEIILRNRVSLVGEFGGTIIKPSKNSRGEYNNSLVRLDDGFVEFIRLDGFMFYGDIVSENSSGDPSSATEEVNMHCFDFNGDNTDGGLWYSNFKNIAIRKFKKDGIRLLGGTDYEKNNLYNRVNQFISFENVRIIKSNAIDSRAIYMYGQNAQINFINCTFSGTNGISNLGTNVWIESTSQDPQGQFEPGPQSSLINFDTCTIEHSELGFLMLGAYAINIKGCWFENLSRSADILAYSKGVDISSNKFSNAGRSYLLFLENSGVTFTNNIIRQQRKVSIIKKGSDRHYYGKNNYHELPGTNDTNYFN